MTMKTKLRRMTGNRCVQLTTIQRNAAGKALVADVKAKNLGASSVDLLRIVKVRRRRCAPSSVLGCRSIPRSAPYAGVLTQLSTGEHSSARSSATECAAVFHSMVECFSVNAAEVANREYPGSTLEYPEHS